MKQTYKLPYPIKSLTGQDWTGLSDPTVSSFIMVALY
jgi:hypothetical protein